MRGFVWALMVGVFACGSVRADELPEGTFVHLTVGESLSRSADVKDTCYDPFGSGCGLISGDPNDASPGQLNKISNSPLFGLGADYAVIPDVRVGAELLIREGFILNDHDGHPANALLNDPGSLTAAKGGVHAYSGMVTVAYDLPVAVDPVQPYLKGGLGVSVLDTQSLKVTYQGQNYVINGDTSAQLSGQIGLGVAVKVTPANIIDLAYQYAWLGSLHYKSGSYGNANGGPPMVSSGFIGRLETQDITVSYRFRF